MAASFTDFSIEATGLCFLDEIFSVFRQRNHCFHGLVVEGLKQGPSSVCSPSAEHGGLNMQMDVVRTPLMSPMAHPDVPLCLHSHLWEDPEELLSMTIPLGSKGPHELDSSDTGLRLFLQKQKTLNHN